MQVEQGWQACEETYSTAVTCTTTGPDAVLNSIPLAAELHRGHKEAQVTAGEILHSSESGGAQMRKGTTWAGGQNSGKTWKDN